LWVYVLAASLSKKDLLNEPKQILEDMLDESGISCKGATKKGMIDKLVSYLGSLNLHFEFSDEECCWNGFSILHPGLSGYDEFSSVGEAVRVHDVYPNGSVKQWVGVRREGKTWMAEHGDRVIGEFCSMDEASKAFHDECSEESSERVSVMMDVCTYTGELIASKRVILQCRVEFEDLGYQVCGHPGIQFKRVDFLDTKTLLNVSCIPSLDANTICRLYTVSHVALILSRNDSHRFEQAGVL